MKTEPRARRENPDTTDLLTGAELSLLLGMAIVTCVAASHVMKGFLQ